MTTEIPTSATERWDEAAKKVERAKGRWVIVGDGGKVARNEKAREALEKRGLQVEVKSRVGGGATSINRRWVGWRTFARTVES